MTGPQLDRRWLLFWATSSLLLLGACLAAGSATGSRSTVALVLLGGLMTIGIAAAVVSSMVSPGRGRDDATHVPWGSTGWFER